MLWHVQGFPVIPAKKYGAALFSGFGDCLHGDGNRNGDLRQLHPELPAAHSGDAGVGCLHRRGLCPDPPLFKTYPLQTLRGSVRGTLIGALPAAGADIAAWMSSATSKKFSKEPEKFGTGHLEGAVKSGAANNSAPAGAWILAMVFGIPGDLITAIVIGLLYMKNLNPGPTSFSMIKSEGHISAFFARPIAGTLGVLMIALLIVPPLLRLLDRGRAHRT